MPRAPAWAARCRRGRRRATAAVPRPRSSGPRSLVLGRGLVVVVHGLVGLAEPPLPPDTSAVEHRALDTGPHVPPAAAVLGEHRNDARPADAQAAGHQLLDRDLAGDAPSAAFLGDGAEHGVGPARV